MIRSKIPLLITGTVTFAAYIWYQYRRNIEYDEELHDIIPSPLEYVQTILSKDEQLSLAYRPDRLPGARDIKTPFGSTRVYEFGPEDGLKILFVHGISTPCISLERLAKLLVSKGCRVILYDLYGRGFSSTPTNQELTWETYSTQILSVIASSPISWTGANSFVIVGYSLGGGIAARFTDCFPRLVKGLVLIGPGGLVRPHHISWQSVVLYRTKGILPNWFIHRLVRRRLDDPGQRDPIKSLPRVSSTTQEFSTRAIRAEVGDVLHDKGARDYDRAVQWQLENNAGYVSAFISSIRHAPYMKEHETYKAIGSRQDELRQNGFDSTKCPDAFVGGKLILVLGSNDSIVIADECIEDHKKYAGKDNVEVILIDGGHDMPIKQSRELCDRLWETWKTLGVVP